MKKIIATVLLLLAVIVGVGFYRGWFAFNRSLVEKDEAAISREMHKVGGQIHDATSDRKSSDAKQK